MEEQCRKIDSQDVDASIDLVELNNLIVKMRSSVKKAKVHVIHKLCRTMKQLKNKKGTDEQVTKNKNRADRLYEEVTLIKGLPVDKVSKFSLANTATFDEVCKNPKVSIETRAMTRLACCQAMQKDVVTFRKNHEDWESLAKFLIYKQTGRRYKKTRTKGAGSQAMKEMVAKQHGGSVALRNTVGQEGNADRKEDSSEECSSDEEGSSSNEKSDEESNSGIDLENRIKIIKVGKVADKDSRCKDNNSENEETSENKDSSENDNSDSGEIGKEITEQSKLVDEPSVAGAKNRTGEKSADEQTTNVHNQRLKCLKIFTSKEDGEESSDEDDSSSENLAKYEACSPKNVEEDEGGSESEVNSGSDTDASSSDAETASDTSITGGKNLVPGVVKVGNVVKKGTMVIQKLNLHVGAEDIAVSSGDEEEEVPDFLLGSSEARDTFFIVEDGEGEERDTCMFEGGDDGDGSGVEEEEDELTRHRGRKLIESVFIGTLSKPESDRSDRNEGYRNFRGGRGRGGRDLYDRGEGQRGFHRDSYQDRGGRRESFQDRGRRGSYHDRDGHRGSFQGRDGHRGSFQSRDRGHGGFRGHRGGDRGTSRGRGGGHFQQAERGSQGERYSKLYENRTYEHQSRKPDDKSSKAAEKVHPSWEASRKRKEQAASIKSFQGKKIKFDDSD